VVAEDSVKGFALRCVRARRRCGDVHAFRGDGAASFHQFAVNLHHTGVAGLDRTKLRMVANMWNFDSRAVDQIDQPFSRLNFLPPALNSDCHLLFNLRG
jgi:hypothetical protein